MEQQSSPEQQPVTPDIGAPPLTPEEEERWRLRKDAMELIFRLQDYLADNTDNAPHLRTEGAIPHLRIKVVDYRPADVVMKEALTAYDAAAAAGATMLYTRENISGMQLGAQRAYARRMTKRCYEAAIAVLQKQTPAADPAELLIEALAALRALPAGEARGEPAQLESLVHQTRAALRHETPAAEDGAV